MGCRCGDLVLRLRRRALRQMRPCFCSKTSRLGCHDGGKVSTDYAGKKGQVIGLASWARTSRRYGTSTKSTSPNLGSALPKSLVLSVSISGPIRSFELAFRKCRSQRPLGNRKRGLPPIRSDVDDGVRLHQAGCTLEHAGQQLGIDLKISKSSSCLRDCCPVVRLSVGGPPSIPERSH